MFQTNCINPLSGIEFTSFVFPEIENKEVNFCKPKIRYNSLMKESDAFSLVSIRNQVRESLINFQFVNEAKVLDFLQINIKLINILHDVKEMISDKLDEGALMKLEFVDFGENHKTLFINVHTDKSWEECEIFLDFLFDFLFSLREYGANKLNVNILPNEL